METEPTESSMAPEKGPDVTIQERFDRDEAILARFGKRQQLRVSAPANIKILPFFS